jgi:ferric-dicitrate binding protein FerR (iron transport regulator)
MNENHNIEDEKWELLAKSIYDQQSTSEEQSSVVEGILHDSKEKDQLLGITKKVDLYFELNKYPAEKAWEKVQNRIQKESAGKTGRLRRLIYSPLLRVAAAVLVVALLSVAGYDLFFNPSASGKLIQVVADQSVKAITLPDGTLVSLNANTRFQYPVKFGKNTREVTIEGEAFFEVKPNKAKPFIIHAGKAQIKVLGTSFNVSAYPSAKSVEVIVKTGKVQVLNKATAETKQNNELILNPGEKGTLVISSNALLKTTNQNPNFIAWKTHDLIFRATSLGEVISNLENVYKVNIRLDDPKLNGLLLTAHFNDYSLDFILKVIETTFQMETQVIDGQYILKAKS